MVNANSVFNGYMVLLLLWVTVCKKSIVPSIHTHELYVDRHADENWQLISPLQPACTETERTTVMAKFWQKDLMNQQPCWPNTSTITSQTQNISIIVTPCLKLKFSSWATFDFLFFDNWTLTSKIAFWDAHEWKATEYGWAQTVWLSFFPTSILVAEAVIFLLRGDGLFCDLKTSAWRPSILHSY